MSSRVAFDSVDGEARVAPAWVPWSRAHNGPLTEGGCRVERATFGGAMLSLERAGLDYSEGNEPRTGFVAPLVERAP